MKKVASHALGCKVNQYESEAIGELFAEKGYDIVSVEEKADIYVINTCTVTNFGDKKSRQLIRKVKRQNPDAIVAVVGCYAQTAPQDILNIEGVNLVIGTKGRNQIVDLVEQYQREQGIVNLVGDMKREREFEKLSLKKLTNRTRAYLKIQDGCSQFCSYCIIPYARGPIRSRDPQDIMEEVYRLADNGFQEIVLTGIHVASYGKDLKTIGLMDIIKQVHKTPGIQRIRLSSIEPNIISREFMEEARKLPKLCHHFHLSLQSGCDRTLSAMNRKYTTAQYREAVALLRQYWPDVGLTTDIIVGFPGETEEDFQACYDFAKEIAFSKIHVFPYSPKKGTPAAERKDQIPPEMKEKRSKVLLELSNQGTEHFLKQYEGKTVEVLTERPIGHNLYEGHTGNYMKVHLKSSLSVQNCILNVKIEEIKKDLAVGAIEKNK